MYHYCNRYMKNPYTHWVTMVFCSRGTTHRAPTRFAGVQGNRKGCPYKRIAQLRIMLHMPALYHFHKAKDGQPDNGSPR